MDGLREDYAARQLNWPDLVHTVQGLFSTKRPKVRRYSSLCWCSWVSVQVAIKTLNSNELRKTFRPFGDLFGVFPNTKGNNDK